MGRCRSLTLLLWGVVFYVGTSNSAIAGAVDDAAIRRGFQMGDYCGELKPKQSLDCVVRAEKQTTNSSELLGLFYNVFLINSLTSEALGPDNVYKKAMANFADYGFLKMRSLQDQTFTSIDHLCLATATKCEKAKKVYREWMSKKID